MSSGHPVYSGWLKNNIRAFSRQLQRDNLFSGALRLFFTHLINNIRASYRGIHSGWSDLVICENFQQNLWRNIGVGYNFNRNILKNKGLRLPHEQSIFFYFNISYDFLSLIFKLLYPLES